MKKIEYWILGLIIILIGIYIFLPSKEKMAGNTNSTEISGSETLLFSTSSPLVASSTSPTSSTIASSTLSTINNKNYMNQITIETNKGTIVFETYNADAPKAVDNFIQLANKGYYDGVIFHRVIEGFMIQGGDPTGTGRGGPGYTFEDELNPEAESYKNGYKRGTVAMANAGPNTNGSQFFIMHNDTPLPNAYTIFGRVVSGMDVVDAIATTPVDVNDKPLEMVVMKKVTVTK